MYIRYVVNIFRLINLLLRLSFYNHYFVLSICSQFKSVGDCNFHKLQVYMFCGFIFFFIYVSYIINRSRYLMYINSLRIDWKMYTSAQNMHRSLRKSLIYYDNFSLMKLRNLSANYSLEDIFGGVFFRNSKQEMKQNGNKMLALSVSLIQFL